MRENLYKRLIKASYKLIIFIFILNFSNIFVMNSAFADTSPVNAESASQKYVGAEESDPGVSPNNPAYQFYKIHTQDKNTVVSVNTKQLGVKNPIVITTSYNDELGWEAQAQYTRLLSQSNAISILLAYGENQMRGNLTFAHAFTPHQRLKLSYEYLRQKIPFNFASGTVNQWVGQNALGADYQYLFNQGSLIHSIDLNATYSKANSKNLPTVTFLDNGTLAQNFRRIAGGTEKTLGTKVNLLPTNWLLFTLGVNYDSVKYDTQYNTTQNKFSGLGGSAGAHILLGDSNEVTGSFTHTVTSNTYQASVNHLFSHFELGLTGSYTQGLHGLLSSKEIGVQITFNPPKSLAFNPGADQSLQEWAATPAVYRQQVLAVKDEKVVDVGISTYQLLPQTVLVGQQITPINTNQLFNFQSNSFTTVIYTMHVSSLNSAANSTPLALQLSPYSQVGANIVSTSAVPGGATLASPYRVSVQAVAYVEGQQVASADNSFIIKVGKTALPPPASISWKENPIPSETFVGNAITPIDLTKYIKNEIGGNLEFSVEGLSWVKQTNGVLTGTPSDNNLGSNHFVIDVWSSNAPETKVPLTGTIVVKNNTVETPVPLRWGNIPTINGQVNQPIEPIVLNNYVAPAQDEELSFYAPNLPNGLRLSSHMNNGTLQTKIVGTPTTAGQYNQAIRVWTKSSSNRPVQHMAINIKEQLVPWIRGQRTLYLGSVDKGNIYHPFDLRKAISLPANIPVTFSATGTLPPGLQVNPAGELVGNPNKAGNWTFNVTAQAPGYEDATIPVNLIVAQH